MPIYRTALPNLTDRFINVQAGISAPLQRDAKGFYITRMLKMKKFLVACRCHFYKSNIWYDRASILKLPYRAFPDFLLVHILEQFKLFIIDKIHAIAKKKRLNRLS